MKHSILSLAKSIDGRAKALTLAGLLLAAPAIAQHPNHPLGYATDREYQGTPSDIDHVDLFSGSLQLSIPIGQFDLTYNSNVWRYEVVADGSGAAISATPDRATTAGLGWHLGMGEVYSPVHWYNNTNRWLYVDSGGGRHTFFRDMHYEENEGDPEDYYTRDGTYLRLRTDPANFWVEIDFPNGTTHRFESGTGGLGTEYLLDRVWSAHGSYQDPDLTVAYSENTAAQTETRTVIDRWNRTHYIHLDTGLPWINKVVREVDTEAFAGQRARYFFTYETVPVDVSCKDTDPHSPNRISVPHLVRIDLPDGSAYSMKDGNQRLYHNSCSGSIEDLPGLLQGIWLPSGGKLAWTYQEYEFPPGEVNSPFNTTAGVATRRTIRSNGTAEGTWTYRTSQVGFSGGNDPEVITEVVAPTGDCTRNYFNARYALDVQPVQRGWEYGLPFVYREASGGRYLSREVWTSNNGFGACAGTKLRSRYVRFRHDTLPGQTQDRVEWLMSNRAADAERTVYHDDGNRYFDIERSEFDGLGHFRRSVATGNFRSSSSTSERRERVVDYSKVSGTYPGSFTPFPATDPWVLGIYDSVQTTEPDAHGKTVRRTEHVFDRATGALECLRVLANGTGRSANDIVTRYTLDSIGQVSSLSVWGAEQNPLPAPGTADCGNTPGQPVSREIYEYDHGVRTKVTPIGASGQPASFSVFDAEIDPSTGLITRSWDSAGYRTDYDYDLLGRRTEIDPQDGGRTVLTYTLPSQGTGFQIRSVEYPASGSTIVGESISISDDFGRVTTQRVRRAGGAWTERTTSHNARGWTTARSTWGDPASQMQMLDFDPFGRPGTIRNPAGDELTVDYQGVRQKTSASRVATPSGETSISKIETIDSHGRVREVLEQSGPGATYVPTTYEYDVGGRVTRIVSGSGSTQTRSYSYDNRGFLLSETLPEKGVSGNGTVYYFDHDAHGRAHRKLDGPNHLGYEFDDLGRLTEIRDLGQGSRLVSEYFYDNAPGFGQGKLWYSIRHNWVPVSYDPRVEEDFEVRQTHTYQSVGGGLSRLETRYTWDGQDVVFDQTFGYDSGGRRTSHRFPACGAYCPGSQAANGRTITFGYDRGRVDSVSGWASSIDYNDSGQWSEIVHSNGVREVRTFDSQNPNRPTRLRVLDPSGTLDYFDSGAISFDEAGHPTSMGDDEYRYDRAGRLVEAEVHASQEIGDPWQESYTYDTFGNLTSKTRSRWGQTPQIINYSVDSSTNRLNFGTYDGAGNLIGWGNQVYEFDALDSLTKAAWMRYLYDGNGERVGAFASTPQGGTPSDSMWFLVRDDRGQLVSEVSWSPSNGFRRQWDYVRAGGHLFGRVDASNQRQHYHFDTVGSLRAVTVGTGDFALDLDFMPYGESFDSDNEDHTFNFAGHERVHSSGLDSMHARFYSSGLGRFMSIDPVAGSAGSPQSLNRYSYADGNPIAFVDPDGRDERNYVKQGELGAPSPSDWNLQVLRHIGQNGHATFWAEKLLATVTVTMTGFTVHAGGGAFGLVGAVGVESTELVLWGPMGYELITSGTYDRLGRWDHLVDYGLSLESTSNNPASLLDRLVGQDWHEDPRGIPTTLRLSDGTYIVIYPNGDSYQYDEKGNLISPGAGITVIENGPEDGGDASAGPDDSSQYPDRDYSEAGIAREAERIDRGFRELAGFACQVTPDLCLGIGSAGGPSVDTRWQFY